MCVEALAISGMTALQSASIYASVAGAGLSAMSAYQGAKSQQAAATAQAQANAANAATADQQARDAAARGDLEQQRLGRKVADVRGRQRAALAANGLDLSFGSPADVQAETDYYGMQDQMTVGENTSREDYFYRDTASNARRAGGYASATASSYNPLGSAAGSLLTSGGQIAEKWYRYTG
jgi:hypothetical protein